MTFVKKPVVEREKDPITDHQIPHAYALVPDREHPGRFYAVHLKGVFCDSYEYVGISSAPSNSAMQLQRLYAAMEKRHQQRGWDK